MQAALASLSPVQVAAVQVLLNQEKQQRERLESALIELQQGRLTGAEQQAAEREAFEREREAFVAQRQAAERERAGQSALPPPPPPMPQALDLGPIVHELASRLGGLELALSQIRGQMAQPVAHVQPAGPLMSPASFPFTGGGLATPPPAPPLYNPAGVPNWRR